MADSRYMPETHRTRVLIVGAGPAGYTAAIYAARAGLQPLLVAGLQPGGQLMITTEVENYPGFAQAVQGPWLMEQMQAQAEHVGTTIHHDLITAVDFTATPFRCRATRATATAPARSSSPPARRRAGWGWSRRSGCKDSASPPAPPATGSSSAASASRSWAAATPRSRKPCI